MEYCNNSFQSEEIPQLKNSEIVLRNRLKGGKKKGKNKSNYLNIAEVTAQRQVAALFSLVSKNSCGTERT